MTVLIDSACRRQTPFLIVLLALLATLQLVPAVASAASPAWQLKLIAAPTNFPPGATNSADLTQYGFILSNVGSSPSSGQVTVTVDLPQGITPLPNASVTAPLTGTVACSVAGQRVTCASNPALPPGGLEQGLIPVDVSAALTSGDVVTAHAEVSGSGATGAQSDAPTVISSAPAGFGFLPGPQGLFASVTDTQGLPATQAGSHPDELDVGLQFPTERAGLVVGSGGGVRDISTILPPGMVVNPNATSIRCSEVQLESDNGTGLGCPRESQIGNVNAITSDNGTFLESSIDPLYNMVPPPGKPAEFGFDVIGAGVYLHIDGGVSAGDYSLAASSRDIPAKIGSPVFGIIAHLWDDPSNPSHDQVRGRCAFEVGASCPVAAGNTPLLTNPTSCQSTLQLRASVDSWLNPSNSVTRSSPFTDANGDPTGVSGCLQLAFDPEIGLQPTAEAAASPSGIDFDLSMPQDGLLSKDQLAGAHLKKAVVTLPVGTALNPSAANGLASCTEAQIGIASDAPLQFNAADPSCPDGSVVGDGSLVTPLLPDPLKVTLYLADPKDNPFHSLLAGYLVAQGSGVTIKLAGRFDLDPHTGRIVATFDDNPQLPFNDLKLHFKGGDRGVLVTPPACGTYQIQSELSPWSGTAPVERTGQFTIDQGCNTGGFSPQLTAGVTNPVAGSSSSFVLQLTRQDGEQNVSGLTTVLPSGLLAKLAGVPLCPELEAATGDCPAGSQVGSAMVGAGAGPTPVYVPQAGKSPTAVYLAGGYRGAPFSLVIKVPAQAGPFDLGVVTVRAALYVDPSDAHVTAVSDPLPQIIQGIPLPYRDIRVNIDRPGFILAPTSCDPMTIAATVLGAPLGGPVSVNSAGVGYATNSGTVAQLSNAFQVGGCEGLPFKPSLTVSTQGRTSKANGASLTVKVAQEAGEANIHKVDLTLPLVLPARLTTLQKACTEAQFAANPAGCPAGSFVGTAKGLTPVLGVPLTGPAILVSHGGAAFPDVVFLLQANERGGSIRIDLVGHTLIKKGITYSRFESVPDAPISSFEASFPQGPHSVLSANGNLCASKLAVPTELVGQNGAKLNQSTRVSVTGCPKTKVLTRAQKLALALKACKKKPKGAKRKACEHQAHKKYGPTVKKAKKSKK